MNFEIYQHPELDGNSYFLKGNQIGFLLLHGFTATTVETRKLGEYLNSNGLTVGAPLLPGHGTTPEDMNRKRWQDWLAAAEDMYMQLTRTCRVIFVGGESMGGLLALLMAAKHPEIAGVLLYAPAIQIPSMKFAWLLSPFKTYVEKKYVKKDEVDIGWQGYNVVPLRAAVELVRMQKIVIRSLPIIHQPTLIFQGRNDHTINPKSSQIVYDGISSKEKQLIWLEESGHCILLDSEWESAAESSWQFIQHHTPKE